MVFKKLFQKSERRRTFSRNQESKDKSSAPKKVQPGKTTEEAVFDVEFAKLRLALVSPESLEA